MSGYWLFLVLIGCPAIGRTCVTIEIANISGPSAPDPQLFTANRAVMAHQRRRRLANALSVALLTISALDCIGASAEPVGVTTAATSPVRTTPDAPQNWPVQTCNDTTVPGSLRYIAVHAISGDTIDFGQLPMLCGMVDSTITLTAGEIVLHQQEITLLGPPPGSGTVTLSGGGHSRVLRHQIYSPYAGTVHIQDLRIANGYADAADSIGGGCVYSDANIEVNRSLVEGCTAHSSTGNAYGGGLHAPHGQVSIVSSKVSGNTVKTDSNGNSMGGGTSSHILFAKYSEFIGNRAEGTIGEGGGAEAHTMTIAYSTIAENISSAWGGGIFISIANLDSTLANTTFSGNHSYDRGGAICARINNLHIFNSTIASNSTDYDNSGGIYFNGTTANIESTIIANNTSATMASGTDLFVKSGTLTGADNAVMSSNNNTSGVIVLTEDPKLASLSWTGGPTRTMNLLPDSLAIGIGNNATDRTFDQRGLGFPRTTGPSATVDIGAVQSTDTIFISDMDTFFF
jgi:predicted outer membrane repeat protein